MTEPLSHPSPLEEASPQSLDELFSRDPFKYTQQDRLTVIREFRRLRATWDEAEARGKAAPKAARSAPGPKPKAEAIDMSLLGLLGPEATE